MIPVTYTRWHHIRIVYGATTVKKIFLNGKKVSEFKLVQEILKFPQEIISKKRKAAK